MTIRVETNTRVDPFGLHFSTSVGLRLQFMREDDFWSILTPCCADRFEEELQPARLTHPEVICSSCHDVFPSMNRWDGDYPAEAVAEVLRLSMDPLLTTIVASAVDRHLQAIVNSMGWSEKRSVEYEENGLAKTFKAIELGHRLSGKIIWSF